MSTIGFDTSNYTTSTAWTDGKTDINVRQILYVKDGERGIRQSDGVFQHIKLMPVMYEKLSEQIDFKDVKAVGVSTRPRCVEGSYMPVFLAGEGYAKVVANTLGVPLYEFSHQDGHIMAGIYSSGSFELLENDFISVHLSGGTTEILKSRYNEFNFDNEIIGGSKDISAGQFIDRVGVALGFPFPAGVHLDAMARKGSMDIKGSRVFCRNGEISYSGPESQAQRQIARGTADCCAMSCWTLRTVWNGLQELLDTGLSGGMDKLVAVGGVMSNGFLRSQLQRYASRHHVQVILAPDGYSADNASGAAFWAFWKERGRS